MQMKGVESSCLRMCVRRGEVPRSEVFEVSPGLQVQGGSTFAFLSDVFVQQTNDARCKSRRMEVVKQQK